MIQPPARLRTLIDLLVAFGKKVSSAAAIRSEAGGWALCTLFGSSHGWSALVASFAVSVLDTILWQMPIVLSKKTTALKSCAAVVDGRLRPRRQHQRAHRAPHYDRHGYQGRRLAQRLSIRTTIARRSLSSSADLPVAYLFLPCDRPRRGMHPARSALRQQPRAPFPRNRVRWRSCACVHVCSCSCVRMRMRIWSAHSLYGHRLWRIRCTLLHVHR